MKRFELLGILGDGSSNNPFRPNTTGSYVCLGYVGNRVLVSRPEVDNTPPTATTLADYYATRTVTTPATPDTKGPDGETIPGQPEKTEILPNLDVNDDPLTSAQKTAVKTRLTAAGVDASKFDSDGVSDRKQLLQFLLRRWLGWKTADIADGLHVKGFDVA